MLLKFKTDILETFHWKLIENQAVKKKSNNCKKRLKLSGNQIKSQLN